MRLWSAPRTVGLFASFRGKFSRRGAGAQRFINVFHSEILSVSASQRARDIFWLFDAGRIFSIVAGKWKFKNYGNRRRIQQLSLPSGKSDFGMGCPASESDSTIEYPHWGLSRYSAVLRAFFKIVFGKRVVATFGCAPHRHFYTVV